MNTFAKYAISTIALIGSLSFADQRKQKYEVRITEDGRGAPVSIDICGKNAMAKPIKYSDGSVAVQVTGVDDCSMYWLGSEGGKLNGSGSNFSGEFLTPSNSLQDVDVTLMLESQKAYKGYKEGRREGTVAVLHISRPQKKFSDRTTRQTIYLGSKLELPNCGGTVEFKSSGSNDQTQYNLIVKGNANCNSLDIQSDDGSNTVKHYTLERGSSSHTIPRKLISQGLSIPLDRWTELVIGEANLVRFNLSGPGVKSDIINARFVDYGRLSEDDVTNSKLKFMPEADGI